MDRLYSLMDVAAFLNVKYQTLYAWIRAGVLPSPTHSRRNGSNRFYIDADLPKLKIALAELRKFKGVRA